MILYLSFHRSALALILVLVLATGCKGDMDEKAPAGPAGPAVEGAPQVDPAALRQAVDRAVEQKLADAQADRIGDKGRGDAARIRTVEARQARLEERLDALERKASLDRKDDPEPARPKDDPSRGASDPEPEPEASGSETPPTVEPEPAPEPDVVEAPAEDVVEAPEEADGELAMGFTPAPPPEGEDAAEPTLFLTRAAVAPAIDRDAREPTDPGTVFDASVGKIYAFMVFKNTLEDEQTVAVVWMKDGKELSRLPDLKVGPKASRWRTWAYVTINDRRRGDWTVEVRGPEDALLGSVRFKVE